LANASAKLEQTTDYNPHSLTKSSTLLLPILHKAKHNSQTVTVAC